MKNEHCYIKENTIFVSRKTLNIESTLLCGQFFRYIKIENGYKIYSKDNCAYCYIEDDYIKIITTNTSYFVNFFDLDTDYTEYLSFAKTQNDSYLDKAIQFGCGIRLLRQDPIEMIISFIISANNNIPRIKKIIEQLCKLCGDIKKDIYDIEYFAFPTIENITTMSLETLIDIGLGYRADYIYHTSRNLSTSSIVDDINKLDSENALKLLCSLKGVGPKVADCILLFGFHRLDTYPVDTWIEKHYRLTYNDLNASTKEIRRIMQEKYGDYSGIMQQYIFNYIRNKQ